MENLTRLEILDSIDYCLSFNDDNLAKMVIDSNFVQNTLQLAADAIEQLMHERFLIGEILVTESKWEIEPADALEKIRAVLRGEI